MKKKKKNNRKKKKEEIISKNIRDLINIITKNNFKNYPSYDTFINKHWIEISIFSKSSTIKWKRTKFLFLKKSKIRKKNSKEEPSIHLSIILAQFSIFTSFIMNIPLLFKRKKEKERKGVDIWWKKKACIYLLILLSPLPPFHLSKLDTTIEERRESVPPHPAFWNLEVAGDPSLRFIVKIVTSTRIFSSGGDNTVIIPLSPPSRQIDRRTDGRTERIHPSSRHNWGSSTSIFTFASDRRVDRAEILYFRQIYFHPQWTRETRGLFIRRTFLILVNDLREKFISIHRCSKEIGGWSYSLFLLFWQVKIKRKIQ